MPDYGLTIKTFCRSDVNVDANFEARFRSWGKIDYETAKLTENISTYDMFDRAGLAFTVGKQTRKYSNPVTGITTEVEDQFDILRLDTGERLSTVGKVYTPVSHWQACEAVFGELVNLGGIPVRLLGFDNGAKIMAQFIVPDQYIIGDKPRQAFRVVVNSLDGKSRIRAGSTVWCPVCENTEAAAMRELSESGFSAKHTKNVHVKLDLVRQELFNIATVERDFYNRLKVIGEKPVNTELIKAFISAMMPEEQKGEKRQNNNRSNQRESLLMDISQSTSERNTIDALAIDLFDGITRFVTERQQKRNSWEQMEYVTTGPGAAKIDSAVNWLFSNVK